MRLGEGGCRVAGQQGIGEHPKHGGVGLVEIVFVKPVAGFILYQAEGRIQTNRRFYFGKAFLQGRSQSADGRSEVFIVFRGMEGRAHSIDSVSVPMKRIVPQLEADVMKDNKARCYANGQPQHVEGKEPLVLR